MRSAAAADDLLITNLGSYEKRTLEAAQLTQMIERIRVFDPLRRGCVEWKRREFIGTFRLVNRLTPSASD